jgi:hypothetical protein
VSTELLGASRAAPAEGEAVTSTRVNEFVGRSRQSWRTGVSTYERVRFRSVYPGVDLVYYGNAGRVEHDFVVAPGADPSRIRMRLGGMRGCRLTRAGDLQLSTSGGEIRQQRPVIYQPIHGERRPVSGGYTLVRERSGAFRVGLQVGSFDRRYPLVIDPVLIYSTYLGGHGTELATAGGIAVGSDGSAYVVGDTTSTDLPTTDGTVRPTYGGFGDAFIAKINPAGSGFTWITYLGGADTDNARAVAVDATGVYVAGDTFSRDFPVVNAYQSAFSGGVRSDAWIAKLSFDGTTFLYSTYLGGSGGQDVASGIAVDSDGIAYVAGWTTSNDFPVHNPLQAHLNGQQNAFVAALAPGGDQLVYSTYLGGEKIDAAAGIAVDAAGRASVAGATTSTGFPTARPFQSSLRGAKNAWTARLTADGSALDFSTYLGGGGNDGATGIALDPTGGIYLTGFTGSTDFPTAAALQPHFQGGVDAFVAHVDPEAGSLLFSTFLGGTGPENNQDREGGAIAVDSAGSAWITGFTGSKRFPVVGPVQKTLRGGLDAFVAHLSADGSSLLFSSYLGGTGSDYGLGISLDTAGDVYLLGATTSRDFPVQLGAQSASAGAGDAFVAKVGASAPSQAPFFLVNRSSISFGAVPLRGRRLSLLLLKNSGKSPLAVSVGSLPEPFSVLSGGGSFTIRAHASHSVVVQYQPVTAGNYTAVLNLTSSDPYHATVNIPIDGTTVPAPQ